MKFSNNMIFIHYKPLQKQYHPTNYYEHVGAETALRLSSIPFSVEVLCVYWLSIVALEPAA